jgi:hypothetical protein
VWCGVHLMTRFGKRGNRTLQKTLNEEEDADKKLTRSRRAKRTFMREYSVTLAVPGDQRGLARSVMCCERFPAIRMDEAIDFEDEESLGHPRNQVYAIIDDAENARRAAKELNSIGIEPANIGLLIGKEDATKLDAATGEHGFLPKSRGSVWSWGTGTLITWRIFIIVRWCKATPLLQSSRTDHASRGKIARCSKRTVHTP